MTALLDQPLSRWEHFRALYLGAQTTFSTPRPKRSRKNWRGVFLAPVCVPFLPTLGVLLGSFMGWFPAFPTEGIALVIGLDTLALIIGSVAGATLNAMGLLGVGALVGMGILYEGVSSADNLYQNICQKMFNKNYSSYPLKKMIENREAQLRRRHALRLDEDSLTELHFCLTECAFPLRQKVKDWQTHNPVFQHRHLEELRARVVNQFTTFEAYTEKLHDFRCSKNTAITKKEKLSWRTQNDITRLLMPQSTNPQIHLDQSHKVKPGQKLRL